MLAVFAALTLASTGLSAQGLGAFSGANATASVNAIDNSVTPRFVLPTIHERLYANLASYMTVAAALGSDTLHSWQSENRKAAFTCQAIRDGSIILVSEVTKAIVKRVRPAGATASGYSFPSEHTALAASSIGGISAGISIPLTIGTAAGRISSGNHYLTDTIFGGLLGGTISHYTRFCK